MSAPVRVTCVRTDTERAPVTELVRQVYARTYGTNPGGAGSYAVVSRGGTVIACFGFDLSGEDGSFPIERIYRLDRRSYPFPVSGGNTLQFGRLVSLEPGAGLLAAHAGFRLGHEQGALYGLVDHDARVHRITRGYGFSFRDLPYAGVDLSQVPIEDHPYFSKGAGRPYLVHLEESIAATGRKLKEEHRALFLPS